VHVAWDEAEGTCVYCCHCGLPPPSRSLDLQGELLLMTTTRSFCPGFLCCFKMLPRLMIGTIAMAH
jgi:hypothetical protein